MYILSIGDSILQALRTLTLAVCETIYSLICFCFDIFNEMGTATLDIDVNGIFKRVEFILGLFMLFRLTFAGIQYLVDPDAMTDKQKGIGSIIKRVLIVIILLGSTNYLFKEAYILQDRIIESRLIEKIILPGTTSSSSSAGADIAWYTFSQFYTLNTKEKTECNSAYKMLEQQFKDLGSMDAAYLCLNDKMSTKENVSNKQYVVNFNGLIALLCGALLLWMIVVYTVQLGIRIFQLAYLQIVAPIPIMMYLVPKGEENLKKWGKQCLSTFLDFFLRLAILDFVILVSQSLMTNQENLAAHFSTNNVFQEGYVVVILIIALFAFAKKVPNLLKEIFPSTGGAASFGFGLKMPDEAKKVGLFGTGAILGASGAAASNALHGIYNGVQGVKDAKGKGNKWKAGLKGFGAGALSVVGGAVSGFTKGARIKNMRGIGETVRTTNSNRDKRDLKQAAGYKPWNAVGDKVLGFAGLDTKAEGMIKEAQWQQQAAEASRGAIWKKAEDNVKDGTLTYEDYSFARSLKQDKDKSGNTIWRGLDKTGKEIIIKNDDLETAFAKVTEKGIDLPKAIRDNAAVDKRIKDEGKKIKGLEAANDSAKK